MGRRDTSGISIIAPTWSPTLRRLRADFLVSLLFFPFTDPTKVFPLLTFVCQSSFLSRASVCSQSRQGSFRSQQEQTKRNGDLD
ncbi:hypothetical protein CPAR01_12639 [Colletotrichum paranaense]|uniref:Uncharacterized protein n=1 Tax=Colletotrichum paranaense TaxID=1914294 RepID=A0ABQ9S6Z4_9PEZI|nr:uncharacterized protein CPAR01_12639 [Colletotrichum paranaense]KAK1528081.1 hypothetical protein CPAR01_12639 [Colletotrichum paranaense]